MLKFGSSCSLMFLMSPNVSMFGCRCFIFVRRRSSISHIPTTWIRIPVHRDISAATGATPPVPLYMSKIVRSVGGLLSLRLLLFAAVTTSIFAPSDKLDHQRGQIHQGLDLLNYWILNWRWLLLQLPQII